MQELWSSVDTFLTSALIGEDDILEAALAANAEAGLPAIDVSPPQGKFLELLARIRGAHRILEVGTLGGYSSICMARALPRDGLLVSLEIDAAHAEVARSNLARAGLAERVEVRVGSARKSLDAMIAGGEADFDMVFIDADKASTAIYFAAALDLVRAGAVVVVDNVVREGAVLDDAPEDPGEAESVRGIRAFMALAAADPRVAATAIQTVGLKGHDGFALALVAG